MGPEHWLLLGVPAVLLVAGYLAGHRAASAASDDRIAYLEEARAQLVAQLAEALEREEGGVAAARIVLETERAVSEARRAGSPRARRRLLLDAPSGDGPPGPPGGGTGTAAGCSAGPGGVGGSA